MLSLGVKIKPELKLSLDLDHNSLPPLSRILWDTNLHVSVFNAVVDHLDEVPGTSFADPVAARVPVVHLGTDGLKDGGNVGPGLRVAT